MNWTRLLSARPCGLLLFAGFLGCAPPRGGTAPQVGPLSEQQLAQRRLQASLEQSLCKVAVYPAAQSAWKLERLHALTGRGPQVEQALEALCREAEGLGHPAVVDVTLWRVPSGWSPDYEVRGIAVRFEDGFSPPDPPALRSIKPAAMPAGDEEPPPVGEGKRNASRGAATRGKG